MSWDINLEVNGEPEFEANMTFNVSGMYFDAFREMPEGFRGLDEMHATASMDVIEKAIRRFADNYPRYKRMEPENGWGSLQDAYELLCKMLLACGVHPDGVWSIK